jgi:hypothetical protein
VPREDEIDAALAQQREHVAGIEDLIAFASGAGDGDEVVVADEDPQVGLTGEPFLDPAVVLTADLALIQIRLRRVDRDQRHLRAAAVEPQARVAGAEGVFVAEVADVTRVMVSGHAHDPRTRQRGELPRGERVLIRVAVVCEVAGDHGQIGLALVHLFDRGAEQLFAVATAAHVNVRELRDQHRRSLTALRGSRPALDRQVA